MSREVRVVRDARSIRKCWLQLLKPFYIDALKKWLGRLGGGNRKNV